MPKQRVTVDVKTPQWRWCDLRNPKDPKYKSGERCKFCREVKERGKCPRYFCLLFNVELSVKGDAVEKTILCMQPWNKNNIIDASAEPQIESPMDMPDMKVIKKAVQDAIRKQRKVANQFIKAGIPAETAYNAASDSVLEDWK